MPDRALWEGAFLGSIAFEILKQLSSFLLAATHRSPAFQAFGIALILLIWINYFSRVVMYAAAWAYTAPTARAARERESRPVPPEALALRARVAASRPAYPLAQTVGPAPPRGGGPSTRGSPSARAPRPPSVWWLCSAVAATDPRPADAMEISHHPGTATPRTAR